jgi:Tol biopolymer transport system component
MLLFGRAEISDVRNITGARRLRGTNQIASLNLETMEQQVLTSRPGEKWSPHWIADGRIAYVSGGPEGGLEFTAGPAGARGEFGSPSWSADGRRMVFHREVDHNWPPVREWHSRDPQFHLVRTGVFPSYSPDGDRLVCMEGTAAILSHSILLMNADGSGRSVLFHDPEKSPLCPAWSPQGGQIALGLGRFFQMVQGRASASLALMQSDGTGLKVLTSGTGNYGFPSWSPDGRRLVYRASGGDQDGLFIMNIETGEVQRLVTGSDHENFPAWSPHGDLIAFTSYRDGDYEIYTIKQDGTELRRLTHSPGNDAHCSWSPDGKWIAFASQRGGFKDEALLHPYNPQPYGDIYVMRADGSDVRQLTDNQFEEATPCWMPMRTQTRAK